ncbi:30S ribosomal protein S8 [Candidatus Woesearchaeota archaeon]|nr:30S ribosomal protein S8 [Candidatus Woesearchaeota archaeon]
MGLNDTLSNALSNILNAEKIGRSFCLIKPSSGLTKIILNIMKTHGFIKDYEVVEDGKGGLIKVHLLGSINKCGAIKPRFPVEKIGFEKFEKRFLPAKEFGLIIVSTSKGVMTHKEAIEKNLGGKLLAFVY